MARVHLVDGTFELYRCFHGAPRAIGPSGEEVGAARALFATLVALLEHERVTHAAVAFDSVITPARSKGGRTAEDLIGAQQPLAADVVRALGFPVWPAGRFQADDLLASGAATFERLDEVEQVVVCTTDNDLAQCVRASRVVLLDRIRGVVTDERAVRDEFGVDPGQIPDLFALVGDRSDGIAGVPGWGKVSAAKLLTRYGSIDGIPRSAADWDITVRGRQRLAAALNERRNEALLARELSVRRDDLPISGDLKAIEWHGARRSLVIELAERLGEDAVVERIARWDDRDRP